MQKKPAVNVKNGWLFFEFVNGYPNGYPNKKAVFYKIENRISTGVPGQI